MHTFIYHKKVLHTLLLSVFKIAEKLECILNTRSILNPSTLCILEALHRSLGYNNSIFNNKFYLQTDGMVQDIWISCFYSDNAMTVYDEKASDYLFKPLIWKRFRDALIAFWVHSDEDANRYIIDALGKIRFILHTENENGFKLLDLRLKLKRATKS